MKNEQDLFKMFTQAVILKKNEKILIDSISGFIFSQQQKKNLIKMNKVIQRIFDPFIAFRQRNCNKTSLANVDSNIDFTLN